jgi:hypothetical protein
MSGFYNSDNVDIFDTIASSEPVWGGKTNVVKDYSNTSSEIKVIEKSFKSNIETQTTSNEYLIGSEDIFSYYNAIASNTGILKDSYNIDTKNMSYSCKHLRIIGMGGGGGGGGGSYGIANYENGGGGGGSGAFLITNSIEISDISYINCTFMNKGNKGGEGGKSGKYSGGKGTDGDIVYIEFLDTDSSTMGNITINGGGGGKGGSEKTSKGQKGGDGGSGGINEINDFSVGITTYLNESGNSGSKVGSKNSGGSGGDKLGTKDYPPFKYSSYYGNGGKGGNGGKSLGAGDKGVDGDSGYYIIYFLNGDVDA